MSKLKDMKGKICGNFTVIQYLGKDKDGNSALWQCQCVCGVICEVRGQDLRSGRIKSCGCYLRKVAQKIGERSITHGGSYTITYKSYIAMKQRCFNRNKDNYKYYGGRGITVCLDWLLSFENFLKDMGPRPSKEYTIERKNVNGNYCPENCIWLLKSKQSKNRRKSCCASTCITE